MKEHYIIHYYEYACLLNAKYTYSGYIYIKYNDLKKLAILLKITN